MDFGIFNVMQQRERTKTSKEVTGDALYLTRAAEEMGMTRAWYAEHHFSNYSLCPSPLMLIAHAAAITKTIRLGTAVVVPPLYMPTRLLGEIAMADELSDGRLDLGVGFPAVGGSCAARSCAGVQPARFDNKQSRHADPQAVRHHACRRPTGGGAAGAAPPCPHRHQKRVAGL